MNRKIKYIVYFIILWAGSIIIFNSNALNKYIVSDVRYRWIGKTIFESHDDITTVFVGTSRTMCSVNVNMLKEGLPKKRIYNFSTNWDGRENQYIIIRDLLKTHRVRNVVLEISFYEWQKVHNYFSYLAECGDALLPLFYIENYHLKDFTLLSGRAKNNLTLFWKQIFFSSVKGYYILFKRVFGTDLLGTNYSKLEKNGGTRKLSPDEMKYDRLLRKGFIFKDRNIKKTDANTHLFLIKKISDLCKKNGTKLSFLFIPNIYKFYPSKGYLANLKQYGRVYIVPAPELYKGKCWHDPYHLSSFGQKIFTNKIKKYCSDLYSEH